MVVAWRRRAEKYMKCGFFVVLNYSGDKLRCRTSCCPELHNYSVEIDETAKKATIAGWLFLNKRTENGASRVRPIQCSREKRVIERGSLRKNAGSLFCVSGAVQTVN